MINIANRINWEEIRAEYIGGGISQRKLADKHGVSADVLMQKANREHWKQDRDKAISKGIAKSQQKAADAISSNAETAARIKAKLLRKLEREIDLLPDKIGSDSSVTEVTRKKNTKGQPVRSITSTAFKLRDLTAAYKDLTADMVSTETAGSDLMRDFVEASRRRLGNG